MERHHVCSPISCIWWVGDMESHCVWPGFLWQGYCVATGRPEISLHQASAHTQKAEQLELPALEAYRYFHYIIETKLSKQALLCL